MDGILYILEGHPVPYTHHASGGAISIPGINQSEIAWTAPDPTIEITSFESTVREFLPGRGVTIGGGDDGVFWTFWIPFELVPVVFSGGGEFTIAHPNPEYDQPITREKFEEEERRELEDSAMDWADHWED